MKTSHETEMDGHGVSCGQREDEAGLDEKALGALLSQATPRPLVPQEHWLKAHEAAQVAWQEQVRRRRQGRAAMGLGLAAAALFAWWMVGGSSSVWRFLQSFDKPVWDKTPIVEALAGLDVVQGEVRWQPLDGPESVDGEPVRLQSGSRLHGRGWLTTHGASRAALRLAGGQSLRVDVNTHLRLEAPDAVWLEEGVVYVDSQSSASLEVRTRHGVARDIGTQFEVRVEGEELRLRVREGEVRLSRGKQEHAAVSGDELRLGSEGALQRGTLAPSSEAWSWSLAVAPPFALEGSSLDDFLEWVTRENGWQLRFASSTLEMEAATIELHGSLENVPLDQAAAMILATCGLEHDLQDGALVVRRP